MRETRVQKNIVNLTPSLFFFFSFLALVIIYQLTADKPGREAEENEALEEV